MVKKLLVVFLLITYMTFVLALNQPTAIIGESDAEKLQENIDKYAPFDDSGDIDLSGYKPVKSKAEAKIAQINEWLEENASWLKAVFGMVPSFTILFVVNVYLILLFLTILVFNSFFSFFPGLNKEINIGIVETTLARVLGVVSFAILLLTKAIVYISITLLDFIIFLWEKAIPTGIIVAIITMIIVVIVFIVLLIYAPQALQSIKQTLDARKKAKEDKKEASNRQALDTIIQKATEGA